MINFFVAEINDLFQLSVVIILQLRYPSSIEATLSGKSDLSGESDMSFLQLLRALWNAHLVQRNELLFLQNIPFWDMCFVLMYFF